MPVVRASNVLPGFAKCIEYAPVIDGPIVPNARLTPAQIAANARVPQPARHRGRTDLQTAEKPRQTAFAVTEPDFG